MGLNISLSKSTSIRDKVAAINNPNTIQTICEILARRCDPYVPYNTGALSRNVTIAQGKVKYNQPYARRQYYGDEIVHNPEYHPLATAYWDRAMLRDHGDEFYAEVKETVKRGWKHGNG